VSGGLGGAGCDGEGSGGFFVFVFVSALGFWGVGGRGNGECGLIEMVVVRFCCRLCRGCYGRWRCRGGGIGIRVRSSRGRVWGAG